MSLTLPTAKTKPTTDLSKQTILIFGAPKLEKTSFAANAPDAIFLECEPGLNHLEVFKVPTYSWEAFLEACKLIAKGDHKFQTVVIDTVDNAFKMCSEHVCAKHGIEYEGDMAHGKGWALVKNEWHRVLTRLASLPYGLILISHAVDRTIETRTGEYTKTVPSLPDRARNVVLGVVDMILYGDSVARKDAMDRSGRAQKPVAQKVAGCRAATGLLFGTLPPVYHELAQDRDLRSPAVEQCGSESLHASQSR